MNQSINQIRDLFLSMTPAARITAALLLGVILVSLGYLFQQHRGGADEYLFNGEFLSPREANAVVAAIAKAKLSGYEQEGGRIRVPSGQKAEYLAAVADAGALPANFDTLMADALDGSPFDSRPIQKQRIKSVIQRQLSMIVSAMDGVEHADVLYDVQEPQGFQKRQVSATVSVRPAAGESLTAKRSKMIRAAVAGAIAGLDPANVNILDQSDGSNSFAGGEVSPDDFDDPYHQTKAKVEQSMQNRIAFLLRDIPGIRVQVTADLDQTLSLERRTVSSEGNAVIVRERKDTESITNTRVEGGQQPGTFANGPSRRGSDEETSTVLSKTELDDSDTEFFPPTTEELLTQAGLVPQDVRVAIAIPTEYVERVWRERNPDAGESDRPTSDQITRIQGDTKTAIETVVKPLLPEHANKDDYKVIQVSYFETLTPEAIEPPSAVSEALFWAGKNSNTLLTAGFAVVGLVMLRSMVKSIPPSDPAAPFGSPALAIETVQAASNNSAEESGADGEDGKRPKLKLKKGSSLRDDLTEIVRDDPDAAAAILRSWIGKAG